MSVEWCGKPYSLIARILTYNEHGYHYYCRYLQTVDGQVSVVHYDSLIDGGQAVVVGSVEEYISGVMPLTTMVLYMMNEQQP